MPSKIRTKDIEVSAVNGECKLLISLELNINLNGNITGSIDSIKPEIKKETEDASFFVPDFSNSEKIKFGKSKGE